jgi:hypothetical protein
MVVWGRNPSTTYRTASYGGATPAQLIALRRMGAQPQRNPNKIERNNIFLW